MKQIFLQFVDVWDGRGKLVIDDLRGPVNVIPFKSDHPQFVKGGGKTDTLEFELPQGLFQLRISLPYFSGGRSNGQEFPMPVVMDHLMTVRDGDDPQKISFCAKLLNNGLEYGKENYE